MMANVLAAFVSTRNRFACTFNTRLPADRRVLLPLSEPRFIMAGDEFADSVEPPPPVSSDGLHSNVSIFSFRFSVICIMCRMGLLCAIMSPSSRCNCLRRSNDVLSIDFEAFKWNLTSWPDSRGTLFERRPRWMRNVSPG